jgi:cbb3-type cytochrome oxidase maturation protein
MGLPLAGLILIIAALLGGVIAMGAFIWAVRAKQFKDLNASAYIIFDQEEPVGRMTENTFGFPEIYKPIVKRQKRNEFKLPYT